MMITRLPLSDQDKNYVSNPTFATTLLFTHCIHRMCVLSTGVVSRIIEAPQNALVVLCLDDRAIMNCTSTERDDIAWTYDGNTVINSPCRETTSTQVFLGRSSTDKECDIVAVVDEARLDPQILSISGPYGCTDRSNDGITESSMVIVLGMFRHYSDTFAQ